MYEELKGKVVLITGAAGALGSTVATQFAEVGAHLALVDVKVDYFQRAFGDNPNPDWLLTEADITDKASVEALIGRVVERFGRLDVLVNIAGGFAGGKPIHEAEEDTWDFMMNLNAKSVFLMSAAAAKVMIEKGAGGRIISVGAKPGLSGNKNYTAYSASKAAVFRLTESMSLELKPHNINVNAVIPSIIDTPANRRDMPNADPAKWVSRESLAGVIMFLASDAARDISGAAIPVYGASL